MAYQVLARKYRPQRFSDVAGQDHVTRTLLNALAQGRIAHGYIFSGHRGIGKTTIARILAMALNCTSVVGSAERPTEEPCLVCLNCREISSASRQESSVFEESHSFDVEEIDAATNRGIDDARLLTSKIQARPTNKSKYRIIILDEAHQITDAAWNALLKTLEEPPEWAVFMFATTQPEDIPQTIRSRCQHFSFHAVEFEQIRAQLRKIATEESLLADDEVLALLAEAGDGSMRDALSIMDQAIASAPLLDGQPKLDAAQVRELMGTVPNTVFERLLEAIGENQSGPVVEEINRLLNAGNSASQLTRQFVRYLRNVLMARIAGERTELLQLSPDERARAGRSALLFSEEDLTRFLGVMLRTFDELNYRQEPRFHLELGLLKLVHLQRLLPVEQLLSQLGGAPARLGGGALPGAGSKPAATQGATLTQAPATRQLGDAAAGASRGASAAPAEDPAAGGAPAFSPFEADSRRKGGEPARPPAAAEPNRSALAAAVPGPLEAAAAEALGHGIDAEPAAEAMQAKAEQADEPSAREAVTGEREASGNMALAAESALPATGDAIAETVIVATSQAANPGANASLNSIREQVCGALEQAGHNTAAALLGNAGWSEQGEGIFVQVAAKKTMLGLTMNAEAEKICREAMRAAAGGGKPRTLTFVPGEGGFLGKASAPSSNRPAPTGSVQARAMENPLVRQAQELFHAEVRSVVDLRNK
jgi:DNA polymerase-3 subunit gamma/tau